MTTFTDRFGKLRRFDVSGVESWASPVRQDKAAVWALAVWAGAILLTAVFLALFIGRLPLQVPIFYSQSWGESQLGNKGMLWLLPSGAALLGLFNFGFAAGFHKRMRFLSLVLFWTGAALSVLTALSVINIVLLIR